MTQPNLKDKGRMVAILSNAFAANQSVNEVVKQDAKCLQRIDALMTYSVETALSHNGAWVNETNDAVMLGYNPIGTKMRWTNYWQMLLLAFKAIGISRIAYISRREKYIRQFHPKQDYFYLWFLSVAPAVQGQGKGSSLLQQLMTYCLQLKLPIYLETSNPVNLPFYIKAWFRYLS